MNILNSIMYFVVLIGVLVFVHEAGHFAMAKLFRVKVHVFSLGFGPKLLGFKKGETLYKISVLPLGGYVRMLGEDPAEEIGPEDAGRAFPDKPLWQRFFIIIGGPAMNLIFPFLLFFGASVTDTESVPAEVGYVLPGSPADNAGIEPGDVIVSIEGEVVETFEDLVSKVAPMPGRPLSFKWKRGDEELNGTIVPKPTEEPIIPIVPSETETVGIIGITSAYLAPIIGIEDLNGPLASAGLQSFDKIVSVEGKKIERLADFEKVLVDLSASTCIQKEMGSCEVSVEFQRMKEDWEPKDKEVYEKSTRKADLAIPPRTVSLKELGACPTTDVVAYVDPKGAAAKAGLKRGDRLLAYNGNSFDSLSFARAIKADPKTARKLEWKRGGETISADFAPLFVPAGEKKDLGIEDDLIDPGFLFYAKSVQATSIKNPALFSSSIRKSIELTKRAFYQTFVAFKLLAQRKISFKSMGGPIQIGLLAGTIGKEGIFEFLSLMALISVNLGILNLLPIPVLDGGHIAFIATEAIRRKPLNKVVKEKIMLVGMALLLTLMVWVTWNDIMRIVLG